MATTGRAVYLDHIAEGLRRDKFSATHWAQSILCLGLVVNDGVPTFGADHRGHSVFFDINKMSAGALDDMVRKETIVRFEILPAIRALDHKFCHDKFFSLFYFLS
jgi:hypothetical protein